MSSSAVSTSVLTVDKSEPSRTDVLTLKLLPKRKKKTVRWSEETIEVNEFMAKKKSKKCCIFHKQRKFGEWSDDDDSYDECEECQPEP